MSSNLSNQHDSPPPVMSLSWAREAATTLVRVCGEIDMSNAHHLADLVARLGNAETARVVLDLAGVRFVDLHGVRALVEIDRLLGQAGGGVTLHRPPRCLTRLLRLTGAHHLMLDLAGDGRAGTLGAAGDGTLADSTIRRC
ncbi:STAS domain-containing protein [Micromonospora coxensis]|uniref:STAS domain-containing protein n=1 Tax=Micromonospora coxensis TaxID=356852 RepID=UPI003427B6A7